MQSLKSLEIRYLAKDAGTEGDSVVGRIIWDKPDRFLHETPSWTLCESNGEQWRYLKDQQTLIREAAPEQSEWLPETVLFSASSGFEPSSLTANEDGRRIVRLRSKDPAVPGEGIIEFSPNGIQPVSVSFISPDGANSYYRIVQWSEDLNPDTALFEPPEVPAENLIDFRSAGKRD
ncbi:MAG: hypothetical protein ACOZB3_12910 [Calditrichota bacterium]